MKFSASINDEVAELLRNGIYWYLDKGRMEEAIELLYKIVRRGGSEEIKGGKGKGMNRKWFDEECMEGSMIHMVKKFNIEEVGFSDHMILKAELENNGKT